MSDSLNVVRSFIWSRESGATVATSASQAHCSNHDSTERSYQRLFSDPYLLGAFIMIAETLPNRVQ